VSFCIDSIVEPWTDNDTSLLLPVEASPPTWLSLTSLRPARKSAPPTTVDETAHTMRARCAWLLAAFAVGCLLPPLAAAAGSASSPNTTGDSRASDSGGGFPIPLPIAPTCPWLADGVYSAAVKNPLLGSLVKRTRLAAPMGPGSWPTQLNITEQDVTAEWAQRQFGWKGAIVVSATVLIDKKAASKWLPMNLLKVAKDTATVFIAWWV